MDSGELSLSIQSRIHYVFVKIDGEEEGRSIEGAGYGVSVAIFLEQYLGNT